MSYREDAARHEIYLAKLASGMLNAHIYPSMDEALKAARLILADSEKIASQPQLIKIMKRIDEELSVPLSDGWKATTIALTDAAVYEGAYSANLLAASTGLAIKAPSNKSIDEYTKKALITLTTSQRVTTAFWEDYWKSNVDSTLNAIKGEIALGYEQSLANSTIYSRIKETVGKIPKAQAETLVRTGMNFYANQAREAMAQSNPVIKYREFSATFDNRTTAFCMAQGGKRWAIDDDAYPRLPHHFNERSYYVFGTGDINEKSTGTKAAVGGKEADSINPARKLKYRGKKDTDIFKPGQIAAGQTHDQWLRQQPDWFIESTLGKTRAKLFKDGGLKIEKFIDMSGKSLTLKELKILDAEAFKKANL